MIYFIAGASGSGKTAIIENLKSLLPNAVIHDFDDIGVPKNADKKWRQEATEQWLQHYLKERDFVEVFCICGQVVLGEVLACPSAKQIDKVNFCLLDVSDFERIQRLKKRNTYSADQNILNWAAWLRMHHKDPQWGQHVLKEDCWQSLDFSVWDQLANWDNIAIVKDLDTTAFSIDQVAKSVADWVNKKNIQNAELIPNTPYKLYKNVKNTFEIIDEQLYAFNKKCVPATQEPEAIDIHYVIKDNDTIIAGICADVYTWKVMYLELLFVNEVYRNKDLATILLHRVEEEAKSLGVTLVHTDSYDFQAKDFYIKQGYEIFGVLDDCPPGHKRYYLKKIL